MDKSKVPLLFLDVKVNRLKYNQRFKMFYINKKGVVVVFGGWVATRCNKLQLQEVWLMCFAVEIQEAGNVGVISRSDIKKQLACEVLDALKHLAK